jgi:prepilin-type processing-associated H-X9-DG protein
MIHIEQRERIRQRNPCASRAFTRTELLAVVTLLSLLVGLATVGLRHWQQQAQRLACASHLRQITQAFLGFADADGRFPEAARMKIPKSKDWVYWQADRDFKQSALAPFHPEWKADNLRCPLDERFKLRAFQFSFVMNGQTERSQRNEMGPAGRILLAEQSQPNDGCWGSGLDEEAMTRRHQGAANAAFADGRVQLLQTDFRKGEW